MQVLLPLAPEIDSIFEPLLQPLQEEVDEAVASIREAADEAMEDLQVRSFAHTRACSAWVGSMDPHCAAGRL